MTCFKLGYGGAWQEEFDDEREAVERAEEVSAAGFVVEVVRRRFGFHGFVTAFPESERAALRARWRVIPLGFATWGDGTGGPGGGHHHYNSIGGHGGHGGGGHGGHHGGGGHGGS